MLSYLVCVFVHRRLPTAESNKTIEIPMISANKSEKLACRFTRGCVTSSKKPMTEMTKKRKEAENRDSELLSDIMKRAVIAPYAIM